MNIPVVQDSFLANRYEFKYVMDASLSYEVQAFIEFLGLELDLNSKNGPYTVNSLYFETPFLDDYFDKESSLLVRKKIRARHYSESWVNMPEKIWLEVKNKRNFSISKDRVEISKNDWLEFIETNSTNYLSQKIKLHDKDHNETKSLKHFIYLYETGRYAPHIVVKYKRTAYLDSFYSKVRVTFDRYIETSYVQDASQNLLDNFIPVTINKTIMEVKFNGQLPWWFKKLIDKYDLHRLDYSKYTHSVVKLRELYRIPFNK